MVKTLYICYFGLREPLVQTQVIPYLRELQKDGIKVKLLTFEPNFREAWPKSEIEKETQKLADAGIEWQCLAYHKRPTAIATAYDIFRGTYFVWRSIGKDKIDVLHGRVHVPTLMGALARKLTRRRPKLLFDIRGFFPEEYTDAGVWPENGWLFRSAKRVEKWLFAESDAFVVLTENARGLLFPESRSSGMDALGRPVAVIPCCVDFERRFTGDRQSLRQEARRELGLEDRFVVTHLGALGGLYLTQELADFLAVSRERSIKTFAMFLTQSDPQLIVPLLEARGFSAEDYEAKRIPSADVPLYLCASDVALSFVKATYATASRSPTKIPEYLASGLPIVANRGVGDVDALIEGDKVGILLGDFSNESYAAALDELRDLGDVSARCEAAARAKFDLEKVGGERYRELYRRLTFTTDDDNS